MIVILPFNKSILFLIAFSDKVSSELVASSRINIFGSLYNSLAIKSLCFCPPESLKPFSPTLVSYPFGRVEIKSSIFAFLAFSFNF